MPKEITVGKPTQKELLARATGQQKSKVLPPPQPAGGLPAGITGNVPLPPGRVVSGKAPSSMTPEERATLEAIGWTPDVPIPTNMAEILEQVRQEKQSEAEEVILPVDPTTPPVKRPETIPLSKLPASEQEHYRELMRQAHAEQKEREEEEANAKTIEMASTKIPGLQEAQRAAKQASAYKPEATPKGEIEDDRDKPKEKKSETGADVQLAFCPHCQKDLAQPTIPEPKYEEKMVFLHALLGEKPFVKEIPLYGGNVIVTFRTLTIGEIDVIWKQAWLDRVAGKILGEADHSEAVNRYRMMLQLQGIRSVTTAGFLHELPDGLNKEVNPHCTAVWKLEEPVDTEHTALPLIEKFIVENILKTENLFRTVNTTCNNFNRLVAKLEAMADNSDFWKPTEGQS